MVLVFFKLAIDSNEFLKSSCLPFASFIFYAAISTITRARVRY